MMGVLGRLSWMFGVLGDIKILLGGQGRVHCPVERVSLLKGGNGGCVATRALGLS